MRRSLLLLLFVVVAALLAGCGNKGPLVLPPTKPIQSAPAPASTVAPASSTQPAADQP